MNAISQNERTLRHNAIQRYTRTRNRLRSHHRRNLLRFVLLALAILLATWALAAHFTTLHQ